VGNTIKLYQVDLSNATDISQIETLNNADLSAIKPAEKTLLLNFDTLNLSPKTDNVEGMTLGSPLPDGRRVLILVSDNNFSEKQITQILALSLDL
jgi:hypothetical protein